MKGNEKKMCTGERIKCLRNEKGYTQEELGNLLGVKKAAIQKYENGAIVNLKVEMIKKLSDIFSVSPNYIVGWESEDFKNIADKKKFFKYILHENFGQDVYELMEKLYFLNNKGKQKMKNYCDDLYKINEYVDKNKLENYKN